MNGWSYFYLAFCLFSLKFDSPSYHLLSLYGKEQREQSARHLLLCPPEEKINNTELDYAE